ncbi:tetraacyldisaccharide 4'-kinase [Leptospira sp. WS39.C2]
MKVFFLLLSPLTWLYQFLFWVSQWKTKTLSLPNTLVISVGNLSVGGTGKTPFVQYLVRYFQRVNKDYVITILSRGYKAKKSEEGAILPDGNSPQLYGDEPSEHKNLFPNVQVIIGKNRRESFLRLNQFHSKKHIVILDDGFQHKRIDRDFDIVLLDTNAPFGNGYTLPLGFLREPISHLKRAQTIIFTKQTEKNKKQYEEGKLILKKFPFNLPTFVSHFQAELNEINLDSLPLPESFPMGIREIPPNIEEASYFLFTGVGNPNNVLETAISVLKTDQIQYRFFPDHFEFDEKVLFSLIPGKKSESIFVTTEKDWVKVKTQTRFIEELNKRKIRLLVLKVQVVISEQSEFESMLAGLVSTYEVKNGLVSETL